MVLQMTNKLLFILIILAILVSSCKPLGDVNPFDGSFELHFDTLVLWGYVFGFGYAIPDLVGSMTVRASKPGYKPKSESITLEPGPRVGLRLDFELEKL